MIKKIFFIPTAVLLFSACSHNNQLAEKSTKDESLNKKQIILSYDEYKKQFDTKNQKVSSKPLNTNSYLLSKQYESVLSNNKEEKNLQKACAEAIQAI